MARNDAYKALLRSNLTDEKVWTEQISVLK